MDDVTRRQCVNTRKPVAEFVPIETNLIIFNTFKITVYRFSGSGVKKPNVF
jgi:hypothetical protein